MSWSNNNNIKRMNNLLATVMELNGPHLYDLLMVRGFRDHFHRLQLTQTENKMINPTKMIRYNT